MERARTNDEISVWTTAGIVKNSMMFGPRWVDIWCSRVARAAEYSPVLPSYFHVPSINPPISSEPRHRLHIISPHCMHSTCLSVCLSVLYVGHGREPCINDRDSILGREGEICVDPMNHVSNWGAYWRHLTNTMASSMQGSGSWRTHRQTYRPRHSVCSSRLRIWYVCSAASNYSIYTIVTSNKLLVLDLQFYIDFYITCYIILYYYYYIIILYYL